MNLETPIMQLIRLKIGGIPGVRLFRNSVGALADRFGKWVEYGLGKGTSDLVGWKRVIVTPEMVGRPLAVFVAIEVKAPGGRTDKGRLELQRNFIAQVQHDGGLAGFANSVEEARGIINGR